jgi:tryptophanyl-tRNA synthetase
MTDQPVPACAGPQRGLSGVQPSGALNLGNYLRALVKFVEPTEDLRTACHVPPPKSDPFFN